MRSFTWTFFLSAIPLIQATCYWQNSTLAPDSASVIAPDDTACFPEQDNSPCCGTGWTCLSDGVCYIAQEGEGFYYRGTCTDRTWDSQQCPGWCFAQNSNTSVPLIKCSEADGEDWYCCDGDENCSCDTGKDALKLGASQPSTVTVIGSTSWPGFVSTSSAFSTSAFGSSGTSSITNGASTTTAGSSSNTATTTISSTTTGTGSAAAASNSTTSGNVVVATKSTSNTAAIAGGVVGGVALLALIGALGWFFGRRHHNDRQKAGGTAAASASVSDGRPYAPEMSAGNDQHVGAWAASQHKYDYAGSELPSTGSHARSEAPGDEMHRPRHELGGYYDDNVDGGSDAALKGRAVEMQG